MKQFIAGDTIPTTHQEVIAAIDAYCKQWDDDISLSPAYSFAHIVLDDYNLFDSDIAFCKDWDRKQEWFKYVLEHVVDPTISNPLSIKEWERYRYDELMEMIRETDKCLNWLLTIPEDVRVGDEED